MKGWSEMLPTTKFAPLPPYAKKIDGGVTHPAGFGSRRGASRRCRSSWRKAAEARTSSWAASQTSPSCSGRPSMTFMFCTACPDAPFMRLSMTLITTMRPARSDVRVDAAVVGAGDVLELRGSVADLHETLTGVEVVVQTAHAGGARQREGAEAHVDG